MNGHEFTISLQKGNDYINYQSTVCKPFKEAKEWAERDLQEVIDIFFPGCTIQNFSTSYGETKAVECTQTVTTYTILKYNPKKIDSYTGEYGSWEEVLSDRIVQKEV